MSGDPTNGTSWLLNQRSLDKQIVGVIGAGTMGAGIAQVAAAAGHPVRLMDVRPGVAADAHQKIGATLDGLVSKGRMTAEEKDALLARIAPERFPLMHRIDAHIFGLNDAR